MLDFLLSVGSFTMLITLLGLLCWSLAGLDASFAKTLLGVSSLGALLTQNLGESFFFSLVGLFLYHNLDGFLIIRSPAGLKTLLGPFVGLFLYQKPCWVFNC
jgi:hypothetical protein